MAREYSVAGRHHERAADLDELVHLTAKQIRKSISAAIAMFKRPDVPEKQQTPQVGQR